jgi:hypothetical protein
MSRSRVLLVLLPLMVTLHRQAEGQKHCRKGIPCGNSCISASKVCHIGGGETAPPQQPVRPSEATPVAPPEAERWLAQAHGRVYYRASCQAAKELPEPIYFKSEGEAIRLGYRRSQVPGC